MTVAVGPGGGTHAYIEPLFLPWDGRRVPITFVGGYLGAGKTTLINAVLASTDRPIAVVVNDVGSIGVDAALVRRRHGDTIELTDGCVCCTSVDELGAVFDLLRSRPQPPDHVLVELSGVADPQRMLPWGSSAGFRLDGLVVVVAADQLCEGALPAWVREHLLDQVRAADLLVLTKVDLVDATTRRHAVATLDAVAPGVPTVVGGRSVADRSALARLLALGGRRPGGVTDVPPPTLFDAHEVHDVDVPEPLTVGELQRWLSALDGRFGGTIVRAKGVAVTADAGPVLVQRVGPRCEIEPLPVPEQGHEQPGRLVVITLPARAGPT